MVNMSALGVVILIEIPVASTALVAAGGYMIKRAVAKADARAEKIDAALADHGSALARVMQTLFPEGGPSLSETLHAIDVRTAVVESHVTPEGRSAT